MKTDPDSLASPSRASGNVVVGGVSGSSVLREPGRAERDPVRHRRRERWIIRSLSIFTPIALLGIWQLMSVNNVIDQNYFPPLDKIWTATIDLINDGRLGDAVWATGQRMLLGFFYGCGSGILFGIIVGRWRLVRAGLEPVIYALWTIPKITLYPLLLIIMGLGNGPIIVQISITCFFVVLIPTMTAIARVPLPYREAAASFQASSWQTFRHVLFPAALPEILVGLRLAAGVDLLVLIGVELVRAPDGLGALITQGTQLFLFGQAYAAIIASAVLGAAFILLIVAIGRRLMPWNQER